MANDSTSRDAPAPPTAAARDDEAVTKRRRRRRRKRKNKGPQQGGDARAANAPAAAASRQTHDAPAPSRPRDAPAPSRLPHDSDPPAPRDPTAQADQALLALRELAIAVARARGLTEDDASALDHFTIPITVPLGDEDGPTARAGARQLLADVEEQVAAMHRASVAFCLGHVYCFLCHLPDCEHSRPVESEQTFAGYAPTGRPSWISFTNLCLRLGDDRIDRLYQSRPQVLAIAQGAAELNSELLSPFGRDDLSYRVRGQVALGLVPRTLDVDDTLSPRVALTVQITEIRQGEAPLRLRVNLLGLGRDEILAAAMEGRARDAAERLRRVLNSADRRLRAIARANNACERRGEARDLDARLAPMLQSLRGELERCFRPQRRRTQHARDRHASGERPTSDAMSDALHARDDELFADLHHGTLVVLGPRRRAHVFSSDGKHVTSLRLRPGEVERKVERERWRPLSAEQAERLRRALGAAEGLP